MAQDPSIRPAPVDQLALVSAHAAGIDISATELVVAIPPDRAQPVVRSFGTYTVDLHQLADWLVQSGIETVAMESTGVYWIPIFEVLDARGIRVNLVNAQHVKMVPGRKSDWNDAQWLQKLHALGFLHGSFHPDSEMRTLRTYLRHRAQVIEHRAPHILHMQKALLLMNLQLSQVLTDITGTTGLAIIRAILAGERDPVTLAQFRNPACRSSADQIAKALTGTWREDLLFVLQQSLAMFDAYTALLGECDTEIERRFSSMKPRWEAPTTEAASVPAKPRKIKKNKNSPQFDAPGQLARVIGIDLTQVPGLNGSSVMTIIAEIGTDMSKWPTAKHFGAWLGLAPRNDISGGKVLRSRALKNRSRATQAFRQAAQSAARSNSAIGAYYRRMRARMGPAQATVATAHKIARVVYHLLKAHVPYEASTGAAYEQQWQEREVKQLAKKAARLGYTLTAQPAAGGTG